MQGEVDSYLPIGINVLNELKQLQWELEFWSLILSPMAVVVISLCTSIDEDRKEKCKKCFNLLVLNISSIMVLLWKFQIHCIRVPFSDWQLLHGINPCWGLHPGHCRHPGRTSEMPSLLSKRSSSRSLHSVKT